MIADKAEAPAETAGEAIEAPQWKPVRKPRRPLRPRRCRGRPRKSVLADSWRADRRRDWVSGWRSGSRMAGRSRRTQRCQDPGRPTVAGRRRADCQGHETFRTARSRSGPCRPGRGARSAPDAARPVAQEAALPPGDARLMTRSRRCRHKLPPTRRRGPARCDGAQGLQDQVAALSAAPGQGAGRDRGRGRLPPRTSSPPPPPKPRRRRST